MEERSKKAVRQASLLEELGGRGYLSFEEISRRFDVTTQTARRDVLELENEGRLRRKPGGAMILDTIKPSELRQRRVRNMQAKERIAERVATLVPNGAAIFLDTGTTCETIAHALARHRGLRILTYSLRIAAWLREATDFTIAIPGGFVRPVDGGVFHEASRTFLESFRFDLAIICVTGIDAAGELGDDDLTEVETVRLAMKHADRVLLAADGSKFGQRGLVRLASLGDVDELITERKVPEAFRALLERNGVVLHDGL